MECQRVYETLTSSFIALFFDKNHNNCSKFIKDCHTVLNSSNYRSEFIIEANLSGGKVGKGSFWLQKKGEGKLKDIELDKNDTNKLFNCLQTALKPLTSNLSTSVQPDKIVTIQKRQFLVRLKSLSRLLFPSGPKTQQISYMHTFKDFILGIEIEFPDISDNTKKLKRFSEHRPATPMEFFPQRKYSESKPFMPGKSKPDLNMKHTRTKTETNYNFFKHKRSTSTIFTKDDSLILLTDESELDQPISDFSGQFLDVEIFRQFLSVGPESYQFNTNHNCQVAEEFQELKQFFFGV